MSFRTLSTALWLGSILFLLWIAYAAAMEGVAQLPFIGHMLSRPHLLDKAVPIVILIFFAWVLLTIGMKQREVARQHAAIPMFQKQLDEADQNRYQPKAFDLRRPRAIRRADLIVECSGRGDLSSLHEAVPAAAALDSGTLVAGYVPLNVYAWILPVLGFIGTASGMASAIDGFKDVLRGGHVQVDNLASELSQSVIPGLSAAFETTILALAAALVAYLCTSALRDWDQEALDQLDRLCIVLLSRIPQPPTPDGQKIQAILERISEQVHNLIQAPSKLEGAANAINGAAETLASASTESVTAAKAMREAAYALSSKRDDVNSARLAKDNGAGDLASAIKDLQKAVLAPIRVTFSRDSQQ